MNNQLKAAIYMVISAMSFSLMQVCIAKTAGTIPLFEQLFIRNAIATVVAYIAMGEKKSQIFGKKENRKHLMLRSVFGFCGMICLFYASANANQGDVAIINKMSPFVICIVAYFLLKEKVTKYEVYALLIAFVGAFIVSNPQFNSNIFPIFIAFLSAIFSGLAYVYISVLKGKENSAVIIFFVSSFSAIMSTPFMVSNFVVPNLYEAVILLMIGGFASVGQLMLTKSYTLSKASEVSIYNYVGIIFSMLFGYVFLGQQIKYTSAVGGLLVLVAGLIVYFGNKKIAGNQR